jgi:uncharacterized lipoprotein YddW (UPF0748 family)
LFFLLAIGLVRVLAAADYVTSQSKPPEPLREFRGAWVATVANIDWPSRPGLPQAQLQAELLAILDRAVALRLNAIVLQVRPACDALYASELEPWSEFLTGQEGRAPEPLWDPLEYAVHESHQRGLELHAWFNPYRARHASAKGPAAANHISRTRPDLVRTCGSYLWLDPGEADVRAHSLRVILDVVRRYDLDGVHMDDYFYPYPSYLGKDDQGKDRDFPDDPSWQKYTAGGGTLTRDDWRRENVNQFVRELFDGVHQVKPWVKVGLSPFGIWRPGNPPRIKGFDQYASLYADARLWLNEGWIDYFTPQLYWAREPAEQSFTALLAWWAQENGKQRHLWPGISTGRAERWGAAEIVEQIRLTRDTPHSRGVVHWNMSALMKNTNGVSDAVAREAYTQPALVPASPWLDATPPAKPALKLRTASAATTVFFEWHAGQGDTPTSWILQTRRSGAWTTQILPITTLHWAPAADAEPEVVALYAADRAGNLSEPAVLERR